jgi:hypothetical protein
MDHFETQMGQRRLQDMVMTVEEHILRTINSKCGFKDNLAGRSPGFIGSVSSMLIDMERLASSK